MRPLGRFRSVLRRAFHESLFHISTSADWRVDFLSSEAKSRSNPDGL